MLVRLSQLVDLVEQLETASFHNRLLATVYDLEMILIFFAFGESKFLDYNRITSLFPCRVANWRPGAGRRVGATRIDSSDITQMPPCVQDPLPTQIFGHVPVGLFIRFSVTHIFNSLKLDILSCPAEEVADWWLTTGMRNGCTRVIGNSIYYWRLVTDYGR